jgi:hypothetical protein
MITAEEYVLRYARNSTQAFLEGKKDIVWIVRVLEKTRVEGTVLQEILDRFKEDGDASRRQELLAACRYRGWLSE